MDSYSDIVRASNSKSAFEDLGASEWTRVGLSSDFVNATVTFNDITGWSVTIAANTNFIIEVEGLLVTPLATNLPRFGFNWSAALAHGIAQLEYDSSASARVLANFFGLTAAGNAQMAAGSAQGTTIYDMWARIRGRTGAAAVTIKGQLAAESAAANAATMKVGSEFRSRIVP